MANPFIDSSALSNAADQAYGGSAPVENIFTLTGSILKGAFGVIGLLFLLLFLYAGYLWMTAMGDPKKVTKAKDILQQSFIGLVIILSSYALSYFVLSLLDTAVNGTYVY